MTSQRGETPKVETLNSPLSDAELCRRNGWGVGDVLYGEQGVDCVTITLTAIGTTHILAVERGYKRDSDWTLYDRSWRRICRAPRRGKCPTCGQDRTPDGQGRMSKLERALLARVKRYRELAKAKAKGKVKQKGGAK